MASFDYRAYVFNPKAEVPTFVKGDAPALLRLENVSNVVIRLAQSKSKENADKDEQLALRPPPAGWVKRTSVKGHHYFLEEKSGKTSATYPENGGSRPSPDVPATKPEPTPEGGESAAQVPDAKAKAEDSTHLPVSDKKADEDQRGRKSEPKATLLSPNPTETSRNGSTSRASSATRVESSDDMVVEGATDPDAYADLYYVEMWRTETGETILKTDLVSNEDIGGWMKGAPPTEGPNIRLLMIPTVTNANGIHASKETFDTIVQQYQLPSVPAMFSQAPQMATYQIRIPLDDDSFVIHARSAISISNASHLSYRYQRSTNSVCGVFLDRRERSDSYIDILRSLQSMIGNWQLPLVALAQHALEISSQDADKTEDLYYLTKMVWSLVSREPSVESSERTWAEVIRDLQGIITTRKLQASAITNLLVFLRRNVSQEDHSFYPLLDAIESVNNGSRLVADRHQQRHDSLIAAAQYRIQTDIDRATYQTLKANKESLERSEKILAATNVTNIRTQKIVEHQRDLAEKTKDLQHEAGVNGRLMAILAVVTLLFLPATTVAQIFDVFSFHSWIFWVAAPSVTVVLLLVTTAVWRWYPIALLERTSPRKDEEEIKEPRPTTALSHTVNEQAPEASSANGHVPAAATVNEQTPAAPIVNGQTPAALTATAQTPTTSTVHTQAPPSVATVQEATSATLSEPNTLTPSSHQPEVAAPPKTPILKTRHEDARTASPAFSATSPTLYSPSENGPSRSPTPCGMTPRAGTPVPLGPNTPSIPRPNSPLVLAEILQSVQRQAVGYD